MKASSAQTLSLVTTAILGCTLLYLLLRSSHSSSATPTAFLQHAPRVSTRSVSARMTPFRTPRVRQMNNGMRVGASIVATQGIRFSDPNQKRRNADAIKSDNQRILDIDSVYDGTKLKGKTILVTGANRGLGLQISQEMINQGAKVIGTTRSSPPPEECNFYKIVSGIDVTDDDSMKKLAEELKGEKIDIIVNVVNNAGYFMREPEYIDSLNFEEELKMIDICAIGPLRTTAAIVNAGLMAEGGSVVMITSQGGSIEWRDVQNEGGPFDYGHHMSKCAANMMGKLMAIELKGKGIKVVILHPGFNKTKMTEKYQHIWEEEGAVDAAIGAKRVCHEIINLEETGESNGKFINCEDGLEIPW